MKATAIYFKKGKEYRAELGRCFVASSNPFYLGIPVKPSTGAWEYLKSASEVHLVGQESKLLKFDIKYKIEVGENTIFFLSPDEESAVDSVSLFDSSDEQPIE